MSLTITVGLSTTNSLISRAIRWVTRSHVSHAWLSYYDSDLDTKLVVGAETNFVMIPWNRFSSTNKVMAEFTVLLNEDKLQEALRWLVKEYLWSSYDYGAAASVALVGRAKWLWRWIGRWFKSRFTSPKKLMCSEAVIRFLLRAGSKMLNSLDPEITNAEILGRQLFTNPSEYKLLAADPLLLEQYYNKKV